MFYVLNIIAALHTRIEDAKDRGATATEYAILVSFIALAVIFGATAFGSSLSSWFSGLSAKITK